mgnify:CR=1 FL=1
MAFHEVRFPDSISRGSSGGPKRITDIVTLRSGFEERNSVWGDSRRSYDAGLGLRKMEHVYEALEFFEARRGRLHGFRWKDWADYKSGNPTSSVSNIDTGLGTGDGATLSFQLTKIYSAASNPYTRTINKPVSGTVLVAVDGLNQTEGVDYAVNLVTGTVDFVIAPAGATVLTAGFEFDVPCRFDQDSIEVNVEQFNAGSVPIVSVLEIKI